MSTDMTILYSIADIMQCDHEVRHRTLEELRAIAKSLQNIETIIADIYIVLEARPIK